MTSPVLTRRSMAAPARSMRPDVARRAPAADRRGTHLRVVSPPGPAVLRRRRTGAALATAMILVFGSLLASAVFHGYLVSGQSHLDQVNRDLEQGRADLARAKLALADQQAPNRIAEAAERLGMERSQQQTWLSPGTGAEPVVTGDPTVDTPETDAAAEPGPTPEPDADVADPPTVPGGDLP